MNVWYSKNLCLWPCDFHIQNICLMLFRIAGFLNQTLQKQARWWPRLFPWFWGDICYWLENKVNHKSESCGKIFCILFHIYDSNNTSFDTRGVFWRILEFLSLCLMMFEILAHDTNIQINKGSIYLGHRYPSMFNRLAFLKERKEIGETTCYWYVMEGSLLE